VHDAPADVEPLLALVGIMLARNAELERVVSGQADQIAAQADQIAAQADQIAALERVVSGQADQIAAQADQIAALERRLSADSSNSSKPPSSDKPWAKPARKRSSRTRSGRKPGKQPGESGSSRSLTDDPNHTVRLQPHSCRGCGSSLTHAMASGCERRQVVDLAPPPPPEITEYQRISKTCQSCGVVTEAAWDAAEVPAGHAQILTGPGCPVRIGPETLARAAFLTCAHYLPVGRSRDLLQRLTAIKVSTGFLAGIRGRAARRLENTFADHMRTLLASAPVLHADETPGRADGALTYVHVACTEYLTMMHVGDRSAATIDAGGVLPKYSGVLMRDGYAGYTHLPALHAWCAAHLLRDLRSISDADPDRQQWALAMAGVLTDAHHAANTARAAGNQALDPAVLAEIRNHYLGALAHGSDENRNRNTELAAKARTLITRFRRYEDMILRFAADLSVPFTNNEAERTLRPVKIQQRTSGGCWRTVQGLTDFAIVHSYLDTANKWGINKLDALHQLFTTGPWLPPALTPS
jgi:transposase